jgi:hypothetical protein
MKYCQTLILAASAVLAAAVSAMPVSPAFGQPDWQEIDTQKDFPALEPAFTVRYPPGFDKQDMPTQNGVAAPGPGGGAGSPWATSCAWTGTQAS